MMKRLIYTIIFFFSFVLTTWACPVCERNQPKVLRGVVHGGPGSNWDYVIIGFFTIITLLTLYYSVKWLIRPGEKENNHIKYSILNDEIS